MAESVEVINDVTQVTVTNSPPVNVSVTQPAPLNIDISLPGPQGPAGGAWFNGTAPPSPATGANGDYYIVTSGTGTGNLYRKDNTDTWVLQGNISGPTTITGGLVVDNVVSAASGTSIKDSGIAVSNLVTLSGNQTVTGIKTFSANANFTSSITLTGSLLSANSTALISATNITVGGNINDFQIIRQHTHTGSTNNFRQINFLNRFAAGTDWTATEVVDGIGIDTSYVTPATTRTWIKRRPQGGRIELGDGATTFLALNATGASFNAALSATGNITSSGTVTGTSFIGSILSSNISRVAYQTSDSTSNGKYARIATFRMNGAHQTAELHYTMATANNLTSTTNRHLSFVVKIRNAAALPGNPAQSHIYIKDGSSAVAAGLNLINTVNDATGSTWELWLQSSNSYENYATFENAKNISGGLTVTYDTNSSWVAAPTTAITTGTNLWQPINVNQVPDISATYVALAGSQTITGNKTFTGTLAASNGATVQNGFTLGSTAGGFMEIGNTAGNASTPFIDFHSGATAVDYDARIIAGGGDGAVGNGNLTFTARGGITFVGSILSGSSTYNIGSTGTRFGTVYANTFDASSASSRLATFTHTTGGADGIVLTNTSSADSPRIFLMNNEATGIAIRRSIGGLLMTSGANPGTTSGGTTMIQITDAGNATFGGTVTAAGTGFSGPGANITGVVHTTGTESVAGVKTFSSQLISSSSFYAQGPVGIGINTSSLAIGIVATSQITPTFQNAGNSANTSSYLQGRYSADANASTIIFAKSRGATVGTLAAALNGDYLGRLAFNGVASDASGFLDAANINVLVDGAPSTSSMPGKIEFSTTNTTSPTVRMTIRSNGVVEFTNAITVTNTVTAGGFSGPGSSITGVVHTTGAESIAGTKTFTSVLNVGTQGTPIVGNAIVTQGDNSSPAITINNPAAAAADVGNTIALTATTGTLNQAQLISGWSGAASTDSYLRFTIRTGNSIVEAGRFTQGQFRIASGNHLHLGSTGIASPSLTTRSAGTKIVLYDNISGTTVDHAIGVGTAEQWYSVPSSTRVFRWYAGATAIATLKGDGIISATGFEGMGATGPGGNTGHVPTKINDTDYNYSWRNPAAEVNAAGLTPNGNMENSTTFSSDYSIFWSTGTGHTMTRDTTTFNSGTACMKLFNPQTVAGNHVVMQTRPFDVSAGDTIEVSYWAKTDSTTNAPYIKMGMHAAPDGLPEFFGGTTLALTEAPNQTLTTTWTQYTQRFVVPSGYYRARPYFRGFATSGAGLSANYFIDDIRVRVLTTTLANQGQWINYTPSFTNQGTVNVVAARYSVIGKTVHVWMRYNHASGAAGGTAVTTLPPGLPIANTYYTGAFIYGSTIGVAAAINNTTAAISSAHVLSYNTDSFLYRPFGGTTEWGGTSLVGYTMDVNITYETA